jgi:TPR repeat protein
MVNMGAMYTEGQGVPQDYAQGATWFRKAAEQGHAKAQYNVGVSYRLGQGAAQDYAQAVAWFRKAAEQGYPLAQFSLGVMHANGQGVPQDDIEALKWLTLATLARPAVEELKQFEMGRDRLGAKMTRAQIAEEARRLRAWMAAFEKGKK